MAMTGRQDDKHYSLICSGRKVCERIEVANSMLSRMKGLLGRSSLEGGEGLLIYPCNSIHMFFMRFAIDAIFLSKDYKVLKIYKNLKPWRMGFCLGAYAVLELGSGAAEISGINEGDYLSIE